MCLNFSTHRGRIKMKYLMMTVRMVCSQKCTDMSIIYCTVNCEVQYCKVQVAQIASKVKTFPSLVLYISA